MNAFLLIPLILGLTVVLQGTLNKKIGESIGLVSAVFINAAIFFILSGILYVVSRWNPSLLPDFLRPKGSLTIEKSWYLVPGICGFVLVTGLPIAIRQLGPAKSFILLISSQILVSLIFDHILGNNTTGLKVAGALLILIGSMMVTL
jgi:uncharacterized membrane protein YdcZ (DUF606 family)